MYVAFRYASHTSTVLRITCRGVLPAAYDRIPDGMVLLVLVSDLLWGRG